MKQLFLTVNQLAAQASTAVNGGCTRAAHETSRLLALRPILVVRRLFSTYVTEIVTSTDVTLANTGGPDAKWVLEATWGGSKICSGSLPEPSWSETT